MLHGRVPAAVETLTIETGRIVSYWSSAGPSGESGYLVIDHDAGRVSMDLGSGEGPEAGDFAHGAVYLHMGGSFQLYPDRLVGLDASGASGA